MSNPTHLTIKVRKSVKLTSDDKKALSKFITVSETQEIAANKIGITRPTLSRVLVSGSGSHNTVELIRQAIYN